MATTSEGRSLRRQLYTQRQRLTDHALERWSQRMPDGARSPEWALVHGVRDEKATFLPKFYGNDAIHLYRGRTADQGRTYTAVLIERNNSIITCWTAESIDDPAVASYCAGRVDANGGTVDE